MQCEGTTLSGKRCRAPGRLVDPTTKRCPAHSEGAAQRLSLAGKLGAEASRRLKGGGLGADELGPLESLEDGLRWLSVIGQAVATGRLHDRPAVAAIRAVEGWAKLHSDKVTGTTLDELEAELKRLKHDLGVGRGRKAGLGIVK